MRWWPTSTALAAEHRQVERLTSRAVLGTDVREVAVQQEILEEDLRAELGVELPVQPAQPRLVHRELAPEPVEARGRETVFGGVVTPPSTPPPPSVCADTEDPRASACSWFTRTRMPMSSLPFERRADALRAADAVAAVGSVHQVDEVQPGGERQPGRDDVVRRAAQLVRPPARTATIGPSY